MPQRLQRLSHSVYECKYHIVFCPKYRYRIFKDAVRNYTIHQIYELCRFKDRVDVLELNGQPDHIHMLISLPPKYALSAFMGYLKGKLALRLFQQFEHLGRRYWGRHLWARGYCVSTVGLNETHIRKYIRWQEERERRFELEQSSFEV